MGECRAADVFVGGSIPPEWTKQNTYIMIIKLSRLRRIVREAVADKVRLPRGPNSRDDNDDRDLTDPMEDRLNVEEKE